MSTLEKIRAEIADNHDYYFFAESNKDIALGLEYALEIIDKYAEQEQTDTWSIKDVADTFKKHGLIREQEPCDDVVSRQAVEDKLVKLCDGLEEIFANIRMTNVDESVCGLCEYDCPAPFECKGFETDECFKLADEIRHKWQSTKDLPPVRPQELTKEEQALLQKWRDNRGISIYDFEDAMNALQEQDRESEG